MFIWLPLAGVSAVDCEACAATSRMDMALNYFIGMAQAGILLWRTPTKPTGKRITTKRAI